MSGFLRLASHCFPISEIEEVSLNKENRAVIIKVRRKGGKYQTYNVAYKKTRDAKEYYKRVCTIIGSVSPMDI